MKLDLTPVLNSKSNYRKKLAKAPIEEKLKLFDKLRERAIEIKKLKTRS